MRETQGESRVGNHLVSKDNHDRATLDDTEMDADMKEQILVCTLPEKPSGSHSTALLLLGMGRRLNRGSQLPVLHAGRSFGSFVLC